MSIKDFTDDEIFDEFEERELEYQDLKNFREDIESAERDAYEEGRESIIYEIDCDNREVAGALRVLAEAKKQDKDKFEKLFSEMVYEYAGVII